MMRGMGDPTGWGMGFGWLVGLVLIGLLIWVVKIGMDNGRSHGMNSPHEETALDILKKRYARGEIDQQEYEAKKKLLEG